MTTKEMQSRIEELVAMVNKAEARVKYLTELQLLTQKRSDLFAQIANVNQGMIDLLERVKK